MKFFLLFCVFNSERQNINIYYIKTMDNQGGSVLISDKKGKLETFIKRGRNS